MGIKAVDLATTDLPYPMEEIDLIIAATYSPLRYRCYLGPYGATPLSHRARQMCECFLSLFFFYQCDGNCTRLFCSGESDQSPDHRSRTQHSLCQRKRSASGHLWGDGAVAFFVSAGSIAGMIPELSISIPKVWDTSAKQPKRCISAHRTVARNA